jgi:uncharacterized protein YbjT (DUF2867 family)
MTTAAVFGCTGLVGSEILTTLLASQSYKTVHTISRRQPKSPSSDPKLKATVDADSAAWPAQLAALDPLPSVVFSALGTTRAQAGGIAGQWKIDHDLNVELAQAAKKAGVATFVFVSSAGTRGVLARNAPYAQMKIGVEDAVEGLNFEHGLVLRPGLIMGEREVAHTGGWLMNATARFLGRFSQGLQDGIGQEAPEIARAAVHAADLAADGKAPSEFWVLEQKDIVRLGRTEWKPSEEPKGEAPAVEEGAAIKP